MFEAESIAVAIISRIGEAVLQTLLKACQQEDGDLVGDNSEKQKSLLSTRKKENWERKKQMQTPPAA